MEMSFDFGALLKNHGTKKHKKKPVQFESVAGGVQKRLESNLKGRRNSRLSLFDRIRNLPRCDSPVPLSDAQSKVEQRRQQLEKWKEEKEKRKKELAAQKKRPPFVAGVAHSTLKYVPPPPPKAMPSTFGRVTRAQAAKSALKQKGDSQSFAPKNASFQPPKIKNLTKVPTLAPVTKSKQKNNYTFNFTVSDIPKVDSELPLKQTRSISTKAVETRMITRKIARELEKATNGRVTKNPSLVKIGQSQNILSGSSSSDMEAPVKSVVRKCNAKVAKTTKKLYTSSSSDMEVSAVKKPSKLTKPIPKSKNTSMSNPKTVVSQSSLSSLDESPTEKSPILKMTTPLRNRKGSYGVTPKKQVPKSESSSEERLRSPKSPGVSVEVAVTPQEVIEPCKRISPCVTLSRGKSNAMREMKQKLEEGLLDEDGSEAESVEHFRRQLASEVTRLNELCDTWVKIKEQTILADAIKDEVLSVVGKARLLISSKMQQFAGLVERCAKPEPGSPLITPADLHGFWDMVFLQIESVDMLFKRLAQRRAGECAEEPAVPAVPVRRAANGAKKAARPAATSRLRDMIAAARKAKKEQEEQPTQSAVEEDSKTFDAGFFCVRSPVRSPAPATPSDKHNLLKAVLSSEAKKASASKDSSSFAMLRASFFSKNLEAEGIAPLPQTPLPQVNISATPGRSILKSTNKLRESGKKSIKAVLFNDSDPDTPNTPAKDDTKNQNGDSGVSSMENKENERKPRLTRQTAMDEDTGVLTRSRRKSMRTPQVDEEKSEKSEKSRRSSRRKSLQDTNAQDAVATPKRSTRRRKSKMQLEA